MAEKKEKTYRPPPEIAEAFHALMAEISKRLRGVTYGDVLAAAMLLFLAQDEPTQIGWARGVRGRPEGLTTPEEIAALARDIRAAIAVQLDGAEGESAAAVEALLSRLNSETDTGKAEAPVAEARKIVEKDRRARQVTRKKMRKA